MKERPILFSAPMVQAILAGRKTQTRRVVKNADKADRVVTKDGRYTFYEDQKMDGLIGVHYKQCPYGNVGDILWVRETFALVNTEGGPGIGYRADSGFYQPEYDGEDFGAGPSYDYKKYPGDYCMWYGDLLAGAEDHNWKPSIFMKRWASRITLEITGIRTEKLNDISVIDAIAEGLNSWPHEDALAYGYEGCWPAGHATPTGAYHALWNDINGTEAWKKNPWVWVVEFKRIKP